MTADTIFDMASITKVAATTPAIWLLIQRGKISLDDPVRKFLPEYRGGWRDEMTIRHLITHTSGLRPDLDLGQTWTGYDTAIALAVAEEPRNRPGTMFRYSDINFELLGEIVRRVAGPFDEFVQREIYGPLGMSDTFFLTVLKSVRPGVPDRVAPTQYAENGTMLRGVVHDPTARRMGGMAGHAGLFSTAHDMALYARMLLRGGSTRRRLRLRLRLQPPPRRLLPHRLVRPYRLHRHHPLDRSRLEDVLCLPVQSRTSRRQRERRRPPENPRHAGG